MKSFLLVLALIAPVESLDHWVQQRVQASRRPALDGTMRAASRIGTPVVVLGTLLAIALLDPVDGVALGRVAVLTLVPTNLAVEGIKRATQRPRPDGERNRDNSSFPSSHAANALALAAVFARRWPRGRAAFWLGAALIAASRVYLNRHFASDVLVGAVLGIAMARGVIHAMRWRAPAPGGPAPPAA